MFFRATLSPALGPRHVRRSHRVPVALVAALLLCVSGCRTAEFVRSSDASVDLAPFLSSVVDASDIRPWHESPPRELGPGVALYYVVELVDGSEREQYLVRIIPCSDRQAELRSDRETDPDFERDIVRSLLSEYEPHIDLWLDEVEDPLSKIWEPGGTAFDEIPVFVETFGPFNVDGTISVDALQSSGERERAALVDAVVFEANLRAACEAGRSLVETPGDALSPEVRERSLLEIARAKRQFMRMLLLVMAGEIAPEITSRIVVLPGMVERGLLFAQSGFSPKGIFLRLLRALGIQFETSVALGDETLEERSSFQSDVEPEFELGLASATFDGEGGAIASAQRFKFEPSLITTTMVKSEFTVVDPSLAPKASAGIVHAEGINPYDSTKRFELRLLGWSETGLEADLLSTPIEEPRFGPDDAYLTSKDGSVLYLLDRGTDPVGFRASWTGGFGSPDGRSYIALDAEEDEAIVIDLGSSFDKAPKFPVVELDDFSEAVSADFAGDRVTLRLLDEDDPVTQIIDLESSKRVRTAESDRDLSASPSSPNATELDLTHDARLGLATITLPEGDKLSFRVPRRPVSISIREPAPTGDASNSGTVEDRGPESRAWRSPTGRWIVVTLVDGPARTYVLRQLP